MIISLILLITVNYVNASWWYLGLTSNINSNSSSQFIDLNTNENEENLIKKYCLNNNIFSLNQRRLCLKNSKIVKIISRGAKLAIDECQHQFKFKRWNCTIFNRTDVFGRVVRTRSRETAFIYAINSAAAMYEVTRACTKGDLKKCSCNKQPENNESNNNNNFKISKTMTQNFEWSGCSDNVLFGYKLSKNFVDSKELLESDKQQLKLRRRDNSYTSKEIKLMNLHNNEVGRRIILKNMKQMCKCHGVSGSCSIKVCWKILPEFRVIGDELMKSYRLAARIKENRVKERVKKLNMIVSRRSSRNSHETELLYKDDLIFIDKSPNFCQHSKRDGIIGTKGRLCSLIEDETISNNTLLKSYSDEISKTCDYLCCGRGYYSKVIETEEDCDCQFQWCCSVKCKKCKKKVTQYYCK